MHCHYSQAFVYLFMTCVFFQQIVNGIQKYCYKTTIKVNDDLEKIFHEQEVIDALGVVYL
jgi:hypothetical protein